MDQAGWSYEDWNGIVYPSRRPAAFHEAAYLADFFDTIEINTSFYYPLRPDHAAHWLDRVAQNPRFLFTAKLWQKFTHEQGGTLADEKAVREGFRPLLEAANWAPCFCNSPTRSIARRKVWRDSANF